VGLVASHDLHEALLQPAAARLLLIADDLVVRVDALRPGESLRAALAAMGADGRDALPVVELDAAGCERFVGLLTRAAAFNAYDRALEHAV
jgi:hypothetical protein